MQEQRGQPTTGEGTETTIKSSTKTEEEVGGAESEMGGMLGAIGETIVEIAQHTTQLVAGPPPAKVEVQEKEEHRVSQSK